MGVKSPGATSHSYLDLQVSLGNCRFPDLTYRSVLPEALNIPHLQLSLIANGHIELHFFEYIIKSGLLSWLRTHDLIVFRCHGLEQLASAIHISIGIRQVNTHSQIWLIQPSPIHEDRQSRKVLNILHSPPFSTIWNRIIPINTLQDEYAESTYPAQQANPNTRSTATKAHERKIIDLGVNEIAQHHKSDQRTIVLPQSPNTLPNILGRMLKKKHSSSRIFVYTTAFAASRLPEVILGNLKAGNVFLFPTIGRCKKSTDPFYISSSAYPFDSSERASFRDPTLFHSERESTESIQTRL